MCGDTDSGAAAGERGCVEVESFECWACHGWVLSRYLLGNEMLAVAGNLGISIVVTSKNRNSPFCGRYGSSPIQIGTNLRFRNEMIFMSSDSVSKERT